MKELPEGFEVIGVVDVKKKLFILVFQIVGLLFVAIFAYIFAWLGMLMRPNWVLKHVWDIAYCSHPWIAIIMMIAMISVHEAIHAVFFWFFTRERPKVGFHYLYASVSMPGLLISTKQYLVSALAPFVLFLVIGIPVMSIVSLSWMSETIFVLVGNSAGAIGDLYLSLKIVCLHRRYKNIYTLDEGTKMTIYGKIRAVS